MRPKYKLHAHAHSSSLRHWIAPDHGPQPLSLPAHPLPVVRRRLPSTRFRQSPNQPFKLKAVHEAHVAAAGGCTARGWRLYINACSTAAGGNGVCTRRGGGDGVQGSSRRYVYINSTAVHRAHPDGSRGRPAGWPSPAARQRSSRSNMGGRSKNRRGRRADRASCIKRRCDPRRRCRRSE